MSGGILTVSMGPACADLLTGRVEPADGLAPELKVLVGRAGGTKGKWEEEALDGRVEVEASQGKTLLSVSL